MKIKKVGCLLIALLFSFLFSPKVLANNATDNTHTLKNAYVVYGSGVSSDLYSNLNTVLNTDNNFKSLTSNADDYYKYIGKEPTTNAAMISSVALAPTDPGSGVKVNIKNYNGENNITQVTSQQYALVAQMAGVTDVTINVTANRKVSGQAALAGVYKAFSEDGITLNTQNTTTANQMLNATQDTINENKNDASYPGKLMAAVGDTTKEISNQKQDGKQMTSEQIKQNLQDNLQKHGISSQINNVQISNIVNVLVNFQNAPISSSKNFSNNITNTINNVKNSTGSLMEKAKNWASNATGKQAIDSAKNWFEQLIDWISGLFNK